MFAILKKEINSFFASPIGYLVIAIFLILNGLFLWVFKGEFNPDMIFDSEGDALSNATIGYGIGNWHYINGRTNRAIEIWNEVYEAGNWASFGFIASEVELTEAYTN